MTGSRGEKEGTSTAARRGREGERSPSLDRRQAQEALLVLGSLGRLISDAMRARVDPELTGNAEVIVVTYLDVQGPLRPADIVSLTGMTSGGVTKLLDRLEKGGYLTREFGTFPGDRRATVLALTPEGRHLAVDYADALLAVADEVQKAAARLCAVAD